MPHINFYADWRRRSRGVPAFREDDDFPPERLLQAIWLHQRLDRNALITSDGQHLHILHPGFWNREPGPDFRQAVIQFDQQPPISGDIEVDLLSRDWSAHHHDHNPAFKQVVLHVVWEDRGGTPLPTLTLPKRLDAPLSELWSWLGTEGRQEFPPDHAGQCCGPLQELSDQQVRMLLRQAARARLQRQAARLQARARQAGWTQALWEGLFRALGYKHNPWPMQRLAEIKDQICADSAAGNVLALQARLLGVAGLLPAELTGRFPASGYVRKLWDVWWRDREQFADCILPRAAWRFSGLRPANHPQRRLALAAHWWSKDDLPALLERWCGAKLKHAELAPALLKAFQVGEDEFWSRHWTLRSARREQKHPLIGPTRTTDLALNVVLPWLWSRAQEGGRQSVIAEMEERYLNWPSAQDNAVLRLARRRLFGGQTPRRLPGAAAQQGLLQIVNDFCDQSNAVCTGCPFPELTRAWSGECPAD